MKRTMIAALLAAATIMPGIASAQDGQRGGRDRGEAAQRGDGGQRGDRQRGNDQRAERQPGRDARPDRGDQRPQRIADRDDRGDRGDRRDRAGWDRGPDRGPDRGGWDRNDRRPPAVRWTGNNGQRWSGGWRQDRRYDWNGYRAYNRGAFRLPRYYAPNGWGGGYRRFSVGVRLAGPLFGRNYWIADPWAYRLPAAYGPYRWVRYYNDAILVDLRTGYTVDVIHGIFW